MSNAIPLYYAMFLAALQQKGSAYAPNGVVSQAGVIGFRVAAATLVKTFLDGARKHLDDSIRAVDLLSQLSRIAQENVAQELKRRTNGAPRQTRYSGVLGLLQALQETQPERFFVAKDTAGREWKAARLVEFLVRDYEYQSNIDWMLSEAEKAGVEQVEIANPDPLSKFAGVVMTLEELKTHRAEIFHPNSRSSFKSHAVQT